MGRFSALVPAGGALWAVGFNLGDVTRVDPATEHVLSRTPLTGTTEAIVAGFGSVWVATSRPGRLYRLSQRTGEIIATIPLGVDARALAAGRRALWVAAQSTLLEIDPEREQLTGTIEVGQAIRHLSADRLGRVYLTSG